MSSPLGLTISQLVADQLPAGFTVSSDYLAHRIKWWQHLFQSAAEIIDADVYAEANWPDDWNMLISGMIIHDVYQKALLGSIFVSTSTGNGGTTSKGAVKKITTGPADVEFQDTLATFANILKTLNTPNSPFFEILSSACSIASRLGVKVSFCQHTSPIPLLLKAGLPCIPCIPKPRSTG